MNWDFTAEMLCYCPHNHGEVALHRERQPPKKSCHGRKVQYLSTLMEMDKRSAEPVFKEPRVVYRKEVRSETTIKSLYILFQ